MPDGRATNGGARRRTGPVVRRVQLDSDVADMLRTLATERRQLTPDVSESELTKRIVSDLIRAAWSELDQEYHEREITEADLQSDLAEYIHDNNIQL